MTPAITQLAAKAKALRVEPSVVLRAALENLPRAAAALDVVGATKEPRNPTGLFLRAFEGGWNVPEPLELTAQARKASLTVYVPSKPSEALQAAKTGRLCGPALRALAHRSDGGAAVLGGTK